MDEMNRYFEAGFMLGRFHSMTQGERNKPVRLKWPDVPEAKKERFCDGWGCTKKIPAGRLVCPWCGRMEETSDFSWLDALDALGVTGDS